MFSAQSHFDHIIEWMANPSMNNNPIFFGALLSYARFTSHRETQADTVNTQHWKASVRRMTTTLCNCFNNNEVVLNAAPETIMLHWCSIAVSAFRVNRVPMHLTHSLTQIEIVVCFLFPAISLHEICAWNFFIFRIFVLFYFILSCCCFLCVLLFLL